MAENVLNLAAARLQRSARATVPLDTGKPEWSDDIHTCCAYAQMLRAEHEAESARIRFEQLKRGVAEAWWEGPEDLKDRIKNNNHDWERYRGIIQHIAALPAGTRAEARTKRDTIGKMWLKNDDVKSDFYSGLRSGCEADDHLFPPSMKLARQ